ncbi:NADH-quinone oxidoreductase subunit A [Fimbriiglobus ruber]|uniref:NADH-quinone oxidoreductase subunit A n=1 Tax=Fimbriiglobus ruber TaxID=1908690 RepID=A0A225DBA7_9BACT|nr:NADH-quinone oxidoreductase subunit A [Fimbriiglobus ruber]OWK38850.1 NADH ubiquinone oxidoreductase chain A [Fimbriiglobus ruber]
MPALVATILVFVAVGIGFLFVNLLVGRLIRPANPSPEKGEVYECGEQPIGSPWIQFDLRFYVVALLFVIFDVEIAFFFPWAVVFGSATRAADTNLSPAQRAEAAASLAPPGTVAPVPAVEPDPELMSAFARFAFLELLVFFGVLLVGFAYLWRRGDLDWVRSIAAQVQKDHKVYGPPSPGMEK